MEKILLNQIRGFGYLYTFGVVEGLFCLCTQPRSAAFEDDYRTPALLQFACEEAKHIHLLKKFSE